MDINKFLYEGARFMAADRPDIWSTHEDAYNALTRMYANLSSEVGGSVSTGGFTLSKYDADGVIEYHLDRKVIEFGIDEDNNETSLFNWIAGSS